MEAFSRGAAGGVFVERNPKAISCIRKNILSVCKSMRREAAALDAVCMDVLQWKSSMTDGRVPSIIFIDPPYELLPQVADALFLHIENIIPEEMPVLVVFEMPAQITLSPPLWNCVHRLGKQSAHQPNIALFQRKKR